MKELFSPIQKISEKLRMLLREGLRGMAEFLSTPSRPENARSDAERAGSYFANLNVAKIDGDFLDNLQKQ